MHAGNNYGTPEHRERGRGRKAFWIILFAAVIAGTIYLS